MLEGYIFHKGAITQFTIFHICKHHHFGDVRIQGMIMLSLPKKEQRKRLSIGPYSRALQVSHASSVQNDVNRPKRTFVRNRSAHI